LSAEPRSAEPSIRFSFFDPSPSKTTWVGGLSQRAGDPLAAIRGFGGISKKMPLLASSGCGFHITGHPDSSTMIESHSFQGNSAETLAIRLVRIRIGLGEDLFGQHLTNLSIVFLVSSRLQPQALSISSSAAQLRRCERSGPSASCRASIAVLPDGPAAQDWFSYAVY